MQYRPEIDGLRALAVLSVVGFHAFPSWFKGGFIGVDVFFVISGFLITSILFESLDKGQFSFTDFFARRIRRIFPALILVMTSSLVFGWFALLANEFAQIGKHIASGAAFITNFILADESGYFDNAAETKPLLHLWSLAVEEQFYIVWPLVLWLGWKRKFNLLTITILVAVISFYLNLRFLKSHPTETFFWPVGRFWELLSGSILAWLLLYKSDVLSRFKLWVDKFLVRIIHSKKVEAYGSTTSNLMSFFGLLLLAYGVIRFQESLSFPSIWTLIPVLGAVLIIASGSKALLNRIFLMNPIAVWFGLISYPLYLWHWPILSFLRIVKEEMPHSDARIIAVLLSIFLAWLTYKLVEHPIRFGYLKHKINAIFIAVMLFSVGAVGYYIKNTDWCETKGFEEVAFPRKGFEHGFGCYMRWYEGKDGWLFLGNSESQTVAKLRLAFEPSIENISKEIARFDALAKQGMESNTKVVLLVGPNKSSVYTDYLPNEMNPSDRRYSTFITDKLKGISNLLVVDPTNSLISSKSTEGLLYWRFGTHWNAKGAYLAFESLMSKLELSIPNINFIYVEGKKSNGTAEFPMTDSDQQKWSFEIKNKFQIYKEADKDQLENDTFGWKGKVINTSALNDLSVWVIGDSFTEPVRPYIEASFKEVRYIGHWRRHVDSLASVLSSSTEKPDLVLIVRVERTF